MRTIASVGAITALTLSVLAFTMSDALAQTTIVPISGKYSKLKLDGICAREGGTSYGSAESGGYDCTKGKNTVECDHGGNCTGYIGFEVPTGGKDETGIAGAILRFSPDR